MSSCAFGKLTDLVLFQIYIKKLALQLKLFEDCLSFSHAAIIKENLLKHEVKGVFVYVVNIGGKTFDLLPFTCAFVSGKQPPEST
ncbi:unnamed protein product [Lactuca virosa]|uniref:Uncharacterized protein n=1 Tax=Lactuca virosa TaxID=75947 RepID=A0AAU9MXX0_9ASTR|nr:unnamed protein product [Lactuca virosa]